METEMTDKPLAELIHEMRDELRTWPDGADLWMAMSIEKASFARLLDAAERAEKAEAALAERDKEIERLRAEVVRCHARLEIDHVFRMPPDAEDGDDLIREDVPMSERAEMVDGIACRDETIKLQDQQIEKLLAALEQEKKS